MPGLKKKQDAFTAKRSALLDERRPLNSQKQKAERTKRPAGERPEPVDVSGEMKALGALQAEADARAEAVKERDQAKERHEGKCNLVGVAEAEVEAYERRLERAQKDLAAKEHSRDAAEAAVDLAGEALGAMPDPSDSIAEVRAHISEADAVNEALEPWREYDRAQATIQESKREVAEITEKIKALDSEEEALLKAAEIPVGGISFDSEGGMQLYGSPLETASGMRRLEMVRDMAVAANPKVRICLLDEANDFGLKALERLRKWATDEGFQVVAARLGLEGPGEIVVEDGEARTPKEATEAAEPAA